jgi:6-phosphogluconolactonase (cycloisomerase 2 family)
MWASRGGVCAIAATIACGCATASGPLVFAEAVRDGEAGVTGIDEPAAIAISPDGAQVYVAGSGANAVAIFARDAATGALHPAGVVRDGARGVDGLDQPGDIALSPDGANVYVAGFDADALAVFARDGTSGKLRFLSVMRDRVGGVRGLGGAVSVVVSPDGGAVYVAGRQDDSIAVFARDPNTGRLRFVERKREKDFGPTALAIAPDGRHLYLSGFDASALAVFERDPDSQRLRRVAIVRDADDPTHALTNAASVAVSPDGATVVAAGYGENALELFERDSDTGELHRLATARAGVDAPARLRHPLGVAFSPDGSEVYAAAAEPGALVAFDVSEGGLRPRSVHIDAGAPAVAEACAVAVSPDGAHVYVAGYGQSAIALFRRGDGKAGESN